MADNIQTVTATLSSTNPATFTIGGDTVDVYGTWTYQWDLTTGLLVDSTMTGSVTVKDTTTGVTTVFTDPTFNFSGSAGGIAEIEFASGTTTPSGSTTSFNKLYLDWTGENPSTLYTGTNPVSGGAQFTSVKQSITTGGHTTTTTYQVNSGHGGTITDIDTCFAAGTHILTPAGEVVVESLRPGDLVVDAFGAEHPVKWLGHRSLDLRQRKSRDDKYLVRVRTSAFAPNVPHRDLLVTQEHCLLVDGQLVPARMLVNDRSIILDKSIEIFTYYHVELERHGILLAEGLATESYLDTGNRGNFANNASVALAPDFAVRGTDKSWADAAAPLATARAIVEPIWQRLNERAVAHGIAPNGDIKPCTDDAGVHLVTAAGHVIHPVRVRGEKHLFILPGNVGELTLRSRTFRPADAVGAFVDDRRSLGVLVGEIVRTQGRHAQTFAAHLTANTLPGWHGLEDGQARWTNGNAILPVAVNDHLVLPSVLEIQIIQAGQYALETDIEPARLTA